MCAPCLPCHSWLLLLHDPSPPTRPLLNEQTENASLSSRLHEVEEKLSEHEAEFKGKLCYNELQLKEQIVYNVSAWWCGGAEGGTPLSTLNECCNSRVRCMLCLPSLYTVLLTTHLLTLNLVLLFVAVCNCRPCCCCYNCRRATARP